MLIENYKKILFLLNYSEKKRLCFIVFFMCFVAVLEVISLGALLPFLHVMLEIENAKQSWILNFVQNYHNVTPLSLTISFIILAILSAVARLILLRQTARESQEIGRKINQLIFNSVTNELITKGKNKKTSDILTTVATKTNMVVNQAVWPALTMTSALLISTVIAVMVISVSPIAGSITILCFGTLYMLLARHAKYQLAKNAKSISLNSNKLLSSLDDSVRGYRDLTVYQAQRSLKGDFDSSTIELANAHASNQFLSGMPRFVIEGMALVFVALVAYILLLSNIGLDTKLPEIAIFVLAAQKIMPLMQQVYGAVSAIRSGVVSVNDNLNLITTHEDNSQEFLQKADLIEADILSFNLDAISIGDTSKGKTLLKNIRFSAKKGEFVGIVGESGSGKSTLLDVISGLQPTQHATRFLNIDFDGTNANLMNPRLEYFSYVSQTPFIMSGTVAENVALSPWASISPEQHSKINASLISSGLNEFASLDSNGLLYEVGEDGCLLSGGQIQRLAIARALYYDRKIILIDEGTSALDSLNRDRFMQTLYGMKQQKIIVMVTHDQDVMKYFDKVYRIQGQNLVCISN